MSGRETNLTKNMSYDRILVLKPIEGTKGPLDTNGKVDPRLFTGDNQLHAKMDTEYGHWYVSYEKGLPAASLQQRWTSFPRMLQHLTEYYKQRNCYIAEIIDT
jgi:hypothetical protein